MDVTTFQATCSVCGDEYTAQRKRQPGYCGSTCYQRDARLKRLKLEIFKEFHGIYRKQLTDPDTGELIAATTVNFTARGWELVGRYCAKSGLTAEEFVAGQLREMYRDEGYEVTGETRIVYPEGQE